MPSKEGSYRLLTAGSASKNYVACIVDNFIFSAGNTLSVLDFILQMKIVDTRKTINACDKTSNIQSTFTKCTQVFNKQCVYSNS